MEIPYWDISTDLQMAVQTYAPDMICSITMAVFVEPCSLQGHMFERRCAFSEIQFGDHNRDLLSWQPGARTVGHTPEKGKKAPT